MLEQQERMALAYLFISHDMAVVELAVTSLWLWYLGR